MEKRESRAKIMLPEIKLYVMKSAEAQPKKNRLLLADELIEGIKSKWPEEIPPKHETVIKLISRARNQPYEPAWSLDKSLDLPADAIAAIFEVQKWLEENQDDGLVSSVREWTESVTTGMIKTNIWPLTVREAIWISRLYRIKTRHFLGHPMYNLWYLAKTYANYERLCGITGIDFDTTILDEGVRHGRIGSTKRDLYEDRSKNQKTKKDGENNER